MKKELELSESVIAHLARIHNCFCVSRNDPDYCRSRYATTGCKGCMHSWTDNVKKTLAAIAESMRW